MGAGSATCWVAFGFSKGRGADSATSWVAFGFSAGVDVGSATFRAIFGFSTGIGGGVGFLRLVAVFARVLHVALNFWQTRRSRLSKKVLRPFGCAAPALSHAGMARIAARISMYFSLPIESRCPIVC